MSINEAVEIQKAVNIKLSMHVEWHEQGSCENTYFTYYMHII